MKKAILSWILAGCSILEAAALDLELRDGTCLPDIQFVRPALRGVTLLSTNGCGRSFLVTVPFSAISLPSLYSLRQYLMQNNLPPWDSPHIHPPAYAASLAALNCYLQRRIPPEVFLSDNALFIRFGAPGSWRTSGSPGFIGSPVSIQDQ